MTATPMPEQLEVAANVIPGSTRDLGVRPVANVIPGSTRDLCARPAAVVFDMDGLLIDSEPWWHQTERAVLARRGFDYPDTLRASVLGSSTPVTARILADHFGLHGQAEQLATEILDAMAVELAAAVPMAGAVALLEALQPRLPLAVASNSPRRLVDAALAAAGLRGYFSAVVARDEVVLGKPAPDVYLEACRRLGVPPAQCVAFEDSGTGVAAAIAAGLTVVAVPAAGVVIEADLVVASLVDPRIEALTTTW